MKYFVRNGDSDIIKSKKIIQEYNNYYKKIEQILPINVKNVFQNKHDAYILKSYFRENDYVMEFKEKIWGKACIIFKNVACEHNINIKEEYWLYDEIYRVQEKYEIHILLNKSDIIILCDDVYISVENKEYFKSLYIQENGPIDLANNNKQNIANAVIDKEYVCGYNHLNEWEKIIYSFLQIYSHINYYKYNNIKDKLEQQYCNFSMEEKENMYKNLLLELEERLMKSIETLKNSNQTMKIKELNDIINKFLEVYNKVDISTDNKNQLYLKLGEQISINLNNTYMNIIEYIHKSLESIDTK